MNWISASTRWLLMTYSWALIEPDPGIKRAKDSAGVKAMLKDMSAVQREYDPEYNMPEYRVPGVSVSIHAMSEPYPVVVDHYDPLTFWDDSQEYHFRNDITVSMQLTPAVPTPPRVPYSNGPDGKTLVETIRENADDQG